MAKEPFNLCNNWRLHCFAQTLTKNESGVMLDCKLNGYDMAKKERIDGIHVYVYANITDPTKCAIVEDNYSGTDIFVDGRISISNFTNDKGETKLRTTIFASRVEKVYK